MKEHREIAVFSFTRTGNQRNRSVQEALSDHGYLCEGYTVARLEGTEGLGTLDGDMRAWIGRYWGRKTFLFIGAAGIAVRYIAPWVRDKYTDSAVLVMDEKGDYVIPLLSGHLGGAVAVARDIESLTHAVAVVTTATDVQERFAVDVFARRNGLRIMDRQLVARISAAVLEESAVGFYSELPVTVPLPQGLVWCDSKEKLADYSYGIAVVRDEAVWDEAVRDEAVRGECILVLRSERPRRIVAGIGCRRGTSKQQMETALRRLLEEHGLGLGNVVKIASIDLKKEEAGILKLAEEYGMSFHTYSAAELRKIREEMAGSDFVREVTGVDNVCERSARCCSSEGRLLQPKRIVDGVALALVEEPEYLIF